jgi:hypothetical protein
MTRVALACSLALLATRSKAFVSTLWWCAFCRLALTSTTCRAVTAFTPFDHAFARLTALCRCGHFINAQGSYRNGGRLNSTFLSCIAEQVEWNTVRIFEATPARSLSQAIFQQEALFPAPLEPQQLDVWDVECTS